jgi:tetratricopeptide (TPR) repeat protein
MPGGEYLELLRRRAADLYRRGQVAGRKDTIATLWDLSLERITGANPAAVQLLGVSAYLAPEPIPLDLFTAHAALLPEPLRSAASDPLAFGDTIAVLVDYSLAKRAASGLRLHRLVQAAIRARPVASATSAAHPDVCDDPRGYPALATELVSALAGDPGTETDEDPHMWSRWRVLAPHAFHLLRQLDLTGEPVDTQRVDTQTVSLACRAAMLAARCLFALGLYGQAQTALHAVLDTARPLLDPEHPDVLAARHQLARVLDKRGEHKQAETELTEVLDARRRLLGDDHPSTLATRNQLAWTLHALGRDNEAEPELLAVLDARLRVLGDEHLDTLVTRMDLAALRHAQGRQQEAETGYQTVLEARRRILDEDHPKVLNTRAYLARLWHEQGRLEDAEAEYRVVLDARRRVLGEDHPTTLTSGHNLASVLNQLGRRQEAGAEYRVVLNARRRILGEDHPDTVATAAALAAIDR